MPAYQPHPMFAASNLHDEMAGRASGITAGGIGAIHMLSRRVVLVSMLDETCTIAQATLAAIQN